MATNTTKEPSEVLANLPEDVQQIVLALSIVSTRIETLDPQDQKDLFALMMAHHKTKDKDERGGIRLAMIEILTQGQVKATPLPLTKDTEPPEGATKWAIHVGTKIRTLRTKARLTQVQLAELAGLPQSHISRIENAEHTATYLTLQKIAKALGVEVGEIDPCAD